MRMPSLRMSSQAVFCLSSADHLHRLRVVADHALHELHVRLRVLHPGQIGGLRRADGLAGLAGRARLNQRRRRLGAA